MNPKLQQLFLVLFLVFFLATIIVYFAVPGKDMKPTWIVGACAIVCYLLYRFSKR